LSILLQDDNVCELKNDSSNGKSECKFKFNPHTYYECSKGINSNKLDLGQKYQIITVNPHVDDKGNTIYLYGFLEIIRPGHIYITNNINKCFIIKREIIYTLKK